MYYFDFSSSQEAEILSCALLFHVRFKEELEFLPKENIEELESGRPKLFGGFKPNLKIRVFFFF